MDIVIGALSSVTADFVADADLISMWRTCRRWRRATLANGRSCFLGAYCNVILGGEELITRRGAHQGRLLQNAKGDDPAAVDVTDGDVCAPNQHHHHHHQTEVEQQQREEEVILCLEKILAVADGSVLYDRGTSNGNAQSFRTGMKRAVPPPMARCIMDAIVTGVLRPAAAKAAAFSSASPPTTGATTTTTTPHTDGPRIILACGIVGALCLLPDCIPGGKEAWHLADVASTDAGELMLALLRRSTTTTFSHLPSHNEDSSAASTHGTGGDEHAVVAAVCAALVLLIAPFTSTSGSVTEVETKPANFDGATAKMVALVDGVGRALLDALTKHLVVHTGCSAEVAVPIVAKATQPIQAMTSLLAKLSRLAATDYKEEVELPKQPLLTLWFHVLSRYVGVDDIVSTHAFDGLLALVELTPSGSQDPLWRDPPPPLPLPPRSCTHQSTASTPHPLPPLHPSSTSPSWSSSSMVAADFVLRAIVTVTGESEKPYTPYALPSQPTSSAEDVATSTTLLKLSALALMHRTMTCNVIGVEEWIRLGAIDALCGALIDRPKPAEANTLEALKLLKKCIEHCGCHPEATTTGLELTRRTMTVLPPSKIDALLKNVFSVAADRQLEQPASLISVLVALHSLVDYEKRGEPVGKHLTANESYRHIAHIMTILFG